MRIASARIKGFGPFKDVSIDFDALPKEFKLIALCGENGEGKSTFVDLLVDGANWRDWPRRERKKIDFVANERDSLLETVEEIGGKRYEFKHLVDGVSGKGESTVFCDDESLVPSGKLAEFYAWARDNLPAKSVVHSSIVSHPAYGSFVAMKATERKDVILLALGVDGIEKLAAAARKEIDNTLLECSQKRDAATVAVNAANVDESTGAVNLAETRLTIAARRVAEAQSALDVAKQLAGDSALARRRYEEQVAARTDIGDRKYRTFDDLFVCERSLNAADVTAAEVALGVANSAHDSAKAALVNAEIVASSLRTKREAANRQNEDRLRVQLELDKATAAKADVEKRIANIRAILANGDKIREAVAKSKELTEIVARLELESTKASSEVKRLDSEIAAHDADRMRHAGAATEATRRIDRSTEALENSELVRVAAATLDDEREAVTLCKAHLESAERELDALRGRRIAGADERIGALRHGLERVMSNERPRVVAAETLDEDNRVVEESEELPDLLGSAAGDVALFRKGVRNAEERLRSVEVLASQLPRVESAEIELTEAHKARNAALCAADEAEHKEAAAEAERAKLAAAGLDASRLERDVMAQIAALAELVASSDKLAIAAGLLEERTEQLSAHGSTVERLTEELTDLPEPPPVPADPDLATLRAAVNSASAKALSSAQTVASVKAIREQLEPQVTRLREDLKALTEQLEATPIPVPPEASPDVAALETELATHQSNHTQAAKDLGAAQVALEAAQRAEFEAVVLREALALAEVELADWTRLAADLGRKGLQAALVDSAGPELTRATNDLLHSCFGTRWTVTYETQRIKDNGDTAEGYDIRIIDTERGRDGVVEDLSDGERTIISEAASLALSELACKRAGFTNPTLIRDESGAALSAERRPMWVAMLRRAATHVNADRVIVISHSEDVQDLCDVKLRVANGTITLEAA
jgi:exonuclease SbcC